jgi:exodeoxyribonuclease-3
MKIISFNTNSIRIREHQLQALVARHDPDIIGIQETKVTDEDFPLEMIRSLGYDAVYHGQKTHYGVALLYKQPPVTTQKGFNGDNGDAQRRFIQAEFNHHGKKLVVMNGYFPQGESRDTEIKFAAKQKFYADLLQHIQNNFSPDDAIILMGDMNVAPLDLDIGIGEDNAKRWLKTGKCSFLPEEREWLSKITSWGMVDTFRQLQPEENNRFSWFDYRSRGFENNPRRGLRIDLIMASRPLATNLIDAGIDYDIRGMEKPSDHCPVWAEFKK